MSISMELFKKVQGITSAGLSIMEGRENGDILELLDETVIVDNFEFGEGKTGEYVAFTIQGNDSEFFFGGSVVTETFNKLKNLLSDSELQELMTTGLPVLLTKVKSSNKRNYTKCILFPN